MNYYDIFTRNAFGNYRDILKEVSYSPMMGEMLSYMESRSAAFVKRVEERVSRPDENYAREIMQLFTIGLVMLREDGTVIKKKNAPVATYENSDIQNVSIENEHKCTVVLVCDLTGFMSCNGCLIWYILV